MYINEQPIIKELSLRYNLDMRVIIQIVQSPLKFVKDKIVSNDIRPIRIRYFSIFSQKVRINKQNIAKDCVRLLLKFNKDSVVKQLNISITDCETILNKMYDDGKYNEIIRLHEVIKIQCKRDMKHIS